MVRISTFMIGKGGELHLVSGSMGLIACVTDLCFQDNSNLHSWDPPEPDEYLRKSVSMVAVSFVLLAGPAAALFWHFPSFGSLLRGLHATFGILCVFLLFLSRRQNELYPGQSWHGSNWKYGETLQVWASLIASFGYVLSHDFRFNVPLLEIVQGCWSVLRVIQQRALHFCCKSSKQEGSMLLPLLSENDPPSRSEDQIEVDTHLSGSEIQTDLLVETNNSSADNQRSGEEEKVAMIEDAGTHTQHHSDGEIRGDSMDEGDQATTSSEGSDLEDVTQESLGDDDSMQSGISTRRSCLRQGGRMGLSFISIAHVPAVFGCSAYLSALAVSACALYVAFLMQEPRTFCFGQVPHMQSTPLVLSPNLLNLEDSMQLGLGNGFILDFDQAKLSLSLLHEQGEKKSVVWESISGVAFIQIAHNPFVVSEASGMINLEFYSHYGLFANTGQAPLQQEVDSFSSPEYGVVQVSGTLYMSNGFSTPGRILLPYTMTFTKDAKHANQVKFEIEIQGTNYMLGNGQQVYMVGKSDSEESFHGMGTQLSYLDLKGGCVPILAQSKGVGRGSQPLSFLLNHFQHGLGGSWQTTQSALPFLMSSRRGSIALGSSELAVFDLSAPNSTIVSVFAERKGTDPERSLMTGRFIHATTTQAAVEEFSAVNGRSKGPPEWVIRTGGAVLDVGGGEQLVIDRVQSMIDAGAAIQAVSIQDWTGYRLFGDGSTSTWWNWEVDQGLYPNWDDLLEWLDKRGVGVLVYVNPHLVDVESHGKRSYRRNFFQMAREIGCLIENEHGGVVLQHNSNHPSAFATLDLHEEGCQDWFVETIAKQIAESVPGKANVRGWIADLGEDVSTLNGIAFHNEFPTKWAEANSKAREVIDKDLLIIQRSSSLYSAKFTDILWTGEQSTTFDRFDGLESALVGSLMNGLSGMAYSHSSIGGHTMVDSGPFQLIRSEELLIRWMEYSAFAGTIFRTDLGTRSIQNWTPQVWSSPNLVKHFRRLSNAHRALGPYRMELASVAFEKGWPLLRPLFFHIANATKYERSKLTRQFMLGEDMIVCPVMGYSMDTVPCEVPNDVRHWKQLCATPGKKLEANLKMVAERELWETASVPGSIDTPASAHEPNNVNLNENQHPSRQSFVSLITDCAAPLGRPCVLYRDTPIMNQVVSSLETWLCD